MSTSENLGRRSISKCRSCPGWLVRSPVALTSLDFSRGLVGSEGAGAGRLLMLIVVDEHDRAPVVASVGRAFQAGGVFRLVGSGFLG